MAKRWSVHIPRNWIVFPAVLLLCGCAAQPRSAGRDSRAPAVAEAVPRVRGEQAADFHRVVQAHDPPVVLRPMVSLTVYHLSVPFGTASGSEAFWKTVDEAAVNVATRDVLLKNGLRVGRAPLGEIQQFIALLDNGPVQRQPVVHLTSGAKLIELPLKRDVPSQIIYHFDARNRLSMRSYEKSENMLCVEFGPAPRKAGDVRVSLCPMVRTLRKRLVAVGDENFREFEFVSPEKFFHLNLRTDIPLDSFLIVAPSPEAEAPMSLGNAFLVREGETEKLEDILLLVPQPMQPKPEQPVEANAGTATAVR